MREFIVQTDMDLNGVVEFSGAGGVSFKPKGEIVRCKDCRWYAYKYDGYHSECDLFKMCFDPDDYCSRAERKDDETD